MSIDHVQIEKSLSQRLKSRLSKEEINHLASKIAELSSNGIEIDEVFPYGIPPQRERLAIRGTLTAAQLGKLGDLIPKLGDLKDYRIFPRGIVAPEKYRVHLNLNR
jgi:hypothetical protein